MRGILPDRRVCWRCGEVRALVKDARYPAMETCHECLAKSGRMFAMYLGRAIYSAARLPRTPPPSLGEREG